MSDRDLHPFDLATRLEPLGEDRWLGHTSPAYANMVGPFGGTTAAVMLAPVLAHPALLGEPLALTVNFAGPVADGGFELHAAPVRTNRTTQHWTVQLRQGEEVVVTATAVTAARRETWSAVEAGFPPVPPPDAVPAAPPVGRARWTASYEMRFVKGALTDPVPGQEGADSETLLWVRDAPPRPLDFLSLAALCDAFFPRLFVRRPGWVPAGTVSMTVYFHADAPVLAAIGAAPLLGHARAQQFRRGFFDQSAELWGPGGELLATTHQVVYFKQ